MKVEDRNRKKGGGKEKNKQTQQHYNRKQFNLNIKMTGISLTDTHLLCQ